MPDQTLTATGTPPRGSSTPTPAATRAHPRSGLGRTILTRLLTSVLVMWAVVTIVFFLARISGDPVALLLPPDATAAQRHDLTVSLGLDKPMWEQYVGYLGGLTHLDLGSSLFYHQSVTSLLAERLPATILLAVAALVLTLVIAIPVGCIAALRRGRAADMGVMSIVLVAQSTPAFWVGIVLILVFAVRLQVLPAAGYGGISHLILPALTLAIYSIAVVSRLLRSSLVDVLSTDYIRTAQAKGLTPWRVLVRHALRNASLPVVTVVGLEIGSLLGGAILTEQIFAWPGVGRLTIEAINNRDFPLVQGAVLMFAATFVVVNFLVDLSYTVLDPRVRSEDR